MDLSPLDGPLQNGELMSKRDVLQCEPLAVLDEKPEENEEVA